MRSTKVTREASLNDRLSDKDLNILSAIFARSNLGMGMPRQEHVDRLKAPPRNPDYPVTLHGAVISLCQEFMECNEHEDGFMQEARMWSKTLRKDGKKLICETHCDIAKLYWGPADPVVKAGAKTHKERFRDLRLGARRK